MSRVVKYFPRDKTVISKICIVYTCVLPLVNGMNQNEVQREEESKECLNIESLLIKIVQTIGKPIISYSTSNNILKERNLLCVYLTVIIPPTEIHNCIDIPQAAYRPCIDILRTVLMTKGWEIGIELRSVLYHYKFKYIKKSVTFVVNDLIKCPFVEDFRCCKMYDGVKANVILSTDKFRQSNLCVDKFYALTVEDYHNNKGLLRENVVIITISPKWDYFLKHSCKVGEFHIYQNVFSLSRFICILEMNHTHITFGVV